MVGVKSSRRGSYKGTKENEETREREGARKKRRYNAR